jgi:uncharacterized SAM-binding protein YcdF (DUF218 family)
MEAIAKFLVQPSSAVTIGGVVTLGLLAVRPARRWALVSGATALAIYLVFGFGPIAFLLLGSLEFRVPPSSEAERAAASTIVVMAGYAEAELDYPLSSMVNSSSAFRLLEATMLVRARPSSTVIISGTGAVATIMRDVIVGAGVPAAQVEVDLTSLSTYDTARTLAPRLGHAPFLLVTSAGHMPRSIGVFRKAGANPVAVPTDYMTKRNLLATGFAPTPTYLYYSDLAMTEHVALMWYRFNGWV